MRNCLKIVLSALAFIPLLKVSIAQDDAYLIIMPVGAKQYKALEENLILTCVAQVDNSDLLSDLMWTGPDGNPIPKESRKYTEAMSQDKNMLFIKDIQDDDQGKYRCSAKYAGKDLSVSVTLRTFWKPKIKEFKNVIAEKGKESKIVCRVFAEPPAQITLMKKDSQREFEVNQQYDDNIIVEIIQDGDDQVFTVTIKEVSDDDDGLYICTARNDGGLATAIGHVTVEFAPLFNLMPNIGRPIKSWDNNIVSLTCIARSIPNAAIEWTALGETSVDVLRDPHIIKMGDGPVSTLQIKTVGNLYYREYRCKAVNKVGENTLIMRVEQAFVPKQLQQASIKTLTATTASFLIVGPLDNGGMPIDKFVVVYKEEGGETSSRHWPAISEQGHTYLLEKLTPEKRYAFKFAAGNAVGIGLFSHFQERVMPKKDVPEEPVIVIRNGNSSSNRFNSVYPDKAEIIWKLPADNGERIMHFTVNYYPVKDGTASSDGHTITEQFPSTQLFLKDLLPNTEYKVEVRAYNSIGYSSPGQVFVRTAHGISSVTFMESKLCGDWTPYKEEKCVKFVERAGFQTQEDAEVVCRSLAADLPSAPNLLTIKTKEEQEFVQRFLFVENRMVDNVWLGLSKTGSLFEWNDGSELTFNNWANQTLSNEQHECVQMESGDGLLAAGLWLRVSCKRKNGVVCERRPSWTSETLQNSFLNFKLQQGLKQRQWEQKFEQSEKKIGECEEKFEQSEKKTGEWEEKFEQRIKHLENNPVPIGFIYVELPNQPSPTTLWPATKWTDVSSNYSGLFFRVVGGQAAPFGQVQDGNAPRLAEVERIQKSVNSKVGLPSDGSWSDLVYTGSYDSTNSQSLRFRLSVSEVRPRNQAVRIWKRIQ